MIFNQTITAQCFAWCQQQQTNFVINQKTEAINLLVIALILIIFHKLIESYYDKLIRRFPEKNVSLAGMISLDGSILFIFGYIIWYIIVT